MYLGFLKFQTPAIHVSYKVDATLHVGTSTEYFPACNGTYKPVYSLLYWCGVTPQLGSCIARTLRHCHQVL